MSEHGYYQPARRSLWDRFWRRLGFGAVFVPAPEDDAAIGEGFAPGRLVVRVVTVLDWRDRLRLLVSGRLFSFVSVQTDKIVVRARSEAKTGVLPPGKETS